MSKSKNGTKTQIMQELGLSRYQFEKMFRPETYEKWKNANKEDQHEYWQHDVKQYETLKAKAECKEHYNHTCQICGATYKSASMVAHHIRPVTDDGNNDQSNLICLCASCHQRVHNGVYIINEDKSIELNYEWLDARTKKTRPDYVVAYEEKHGVAIFGGKTNGYYYFNGLVKTDISAQEMKDDVYLDLFDPEMIKKIEEQRIERVYRAQNIKILQDNVDKAREIFKKDRTEENHNLWKAAVADLKEFKNNHLSSQQLNKMKEN